MESKLIKGQGVVKISSPATGVMCMGSDPSAPSTTQDEKQSLDLITKEKWKVIKKKGFRKIIVKQPM